MYRDRYLRDTEKKCLGGNSAWVFQDTQKVIKSVPGQRAFRKAGSHRQQKPPALWEKLSSDKPLVL